ncbi:MAG: DUF4968 domain-containing protein, partial [Duncaniella sp.]|nr:DUF4968 domain-containing protein [Duncaniella sp.]
MKLRPFSAIALAGLLAASCATGKYQKSDNGITVNVASTDENSVKKVRLQVIGDKIIRVTATPDDKFAPDASLVTVPQSAKPEFKVEETDSTVTVVTADVRATVSLTTGDVKFYNTEGKLIVSEADGGREFSPIEVEGTRGYT